MFLTTLQMEERLHLLTYSIYSSNCCIHDLLILYNVYEQLLDEVERSYGRFEELMLFLQFDKSICMWLQ